MRKKLKRAEEKQKTSGINRMAFADYKFTQEDKLMLTMIKMICENTPPEKRWRRPINAADSKPLPTTTPTESDSVPISAPIMKPTKSESTSTVSTTTRMSPASCGTQSLRVSGNPKSKKHPKPLSLIIQEL